MVLTHCPYVGELWLHHFSMLLLCTGLKYLTKSFCHLLLQYSAKQAVTGLLVQDAAKKFVYQALGVVGIYTTPWTDTAGVDAVMFIATQTTTCEAERTNSNAKQD